VCVCVCVCVCLRARVYKVNDKLLIVHDVVNDVADDAEYANDNKR